MTRALAGRHSRRRLLGGLAAVALGGVLGRAGKAEAACTAYGLPCADATACCNGSVCSGGACRCPAETDVCTTASGPACVACPPGQVLGSGCRCLCANGGTDCGGTCVQTTSDPANCGACGNACAPGQACLNGQCRGCPAGTVPCGGGCVGACAAGYGLDGACRCVGELGTACLGGHTCRSGHCVNGVCCDTDCADQCHLCDASTGGVCTPLTGTPCDDGDACTQTDTCQAGACVGGDPVVCTALDECHDAGTCDPATGACSNPAKSDGAACAGGVCCGAVCQECCGDADCVLPETCGGGGTPNVCGCTPATTCPAGQTCGTAPDGCGGTLNCGSCTSSDTVCHGGSCVICRCNIGLFCADGTCKLY